MGSVLGTAASGLGGFVGNVISAPFNSVSCERVCSGTWDLLCFIEHLCITSLLKFILAVILLLIVLYAFYLLCKLGVVKCLAKNGCKLLYMPCWGGCHLLHHLWRKVRDTERVYRGRRGQQQPDDDDIELGNTDISTSSYDVRYRGRSPSPSSASDYSGHQHRGGGAAATTGRSSRWESPLASASSVRVRKKDRLRQSLRPRRAGSKAEHAMRISRESDGEQRRRQHPHHHPQSIGVGARRKEASSRDHHASPHHPPSIGTKRKEASPLQVSSLDHHASPHHPPSTGTKRKEASPLHDHGAAAHRGHSHAHRRT